MGSLEEQGPQTPMGDFLLAERIALLIAQRAQDAGHDTLVLPVLPFGGADYFGSVPGGLSLGQTTLRAVLRDVLDGLARHGLTRILVVNGHGGNAGAIHDETLALRHRTGNRGPEPAHLAHRRHDPGRSSWAPPKHAPASAHGADPLGSVAAHLLPALVRPDLVPRTPRARPPRSSASTSAASATARFRGAEIDLPIELDRIAPGGVAGGRSARLLGRDGGGGDGAVGGDRGGVDREVVGQSRRRPGLCPGPAKGLGPWIPLLCQPQRRRH